VTLPAAGWFPDPQDASRLRWWDGRTWGAATRALPARREPVVPVAAAPVGPSFSVQTAPVRTRAWASGSGVRRVCAVTVAAVLLALLSIVFDPWGVCSVLAVVAGVVGVVRPGATGGWRLLARSLAASAIVVAVATGIVVAAPLLHAA